MCLYLAKKKYVHTSKASRKEWFKNKQRNLVEFLFQVNPLILFYEWSHKHIKINWKISDWNVETFVKCPGNWPIHLEHFVYWNTVSMLNITFVALLVKINNSNDILIYKFSFCIESILYPHIVICGFASLYNKYMCVSITIQWKKKQNDCDACETSIWKTKSKFT